MSLLKRDRQIKLFFIFFQPGQIEVIILSENKKRVGKLGFDSYLIIYLQ